MTARAHLRIVARDTTGAVQASKAVTFFEAADGTTPFAGSLYSAVSGGSPVVSHTTDSTGVLERWTDAADARPVKLTVAGVAAQINASFTLDPRDIILQGGSVAANINGYDGTGWAQTVKAVQNDAGVAANIARFLDSNDAAILRLWRSTGGNLAASINLLDDTIPTLSTFEVKKATGTSGFNAVNHEVQVNAAGIVVAGLQVTAKQTVAGQSNAIAGRFISERSGSASNDGVGYAVEGQVKTTATSSDPSFSVGFYANSAVVTSGVAPGAAFFAGGGGVTWPYGLYYRDSAAAHIASISSAGVLALGTTPSTAGLIRLPTTTGISFRNFGNTANIDMIRSDASNNVLIGAVSAAGGMAATAVLGATGVSMQVSTNVEFLANSTGSIVGRAAGQVGFYGGAGAVKSAALTQTYATADRTHANPTAVALTDNSGGAASGTLAAITGGGAGCENATKNAIASLAAQIAALIADVADAKQFLNSVVDDLQAVNLVG